MGKCTFFFAFIFLLFSCQKEEIFFDAAADENLELPLLLRLDGKNCSLDSERAILKYSINGKSIENYNPYIEFQSYSEITFGTTDLSNSSFNHLGDLEINKPYQITINSREKTKQFTLLFTEIPIFQIVTHDPIVNEPKTLARLTLNYPEKERLSEKNWAGIETRGASTFKYDKKSFGIGIFPDKSTKSSISQSYFNLKSNSKWILDAMFADESRLRNKVSFDLWNSISGPINHIGIESKFVEVFINNEAQGLYCFTEVYTEEFLNLSSESVLYQGTDNSLATKFRALPENDPNGDEWSKWEQKFPDPSQIIDWEDFKALSSLIVESSNLDFKNNIAGIIDIDNVIDYFLFINLCKGGDNIGKNWYFLRLNKSAKFNIAPWDMDRTWGRNSFTNVTTYTAIITNGLFERLEEVGPENYNQRLKERWKELRLKEFSEANLISLFTRNFAELQAYKILDLENTLWDTQVNLELEQSYIVTWVHNRLAFLDEHFGT